MTTTGSHDQNETREGEEAPPRGVRTMSIVRWGLVIVMGLVAAGSILSHFGFSLSVAGNASKQDGTIYYCPMHPQIQQDHAGQCPICSMTLVPKPTGPVKPSATMAPATAATKASSQDAGPGKYYCPMHPHVTSDDPNAKCDLCGGMKLVPNPAAGGNGGPAARTLAAEPVPGLVPIDLPVERVQKIGVRTARVTQESLVNDLRTVGVVEASEKGFVQVSPRFSGWIEELLVAQTGQRVKRGEPLATIYSPEVLQAQQELLNAIRWSASPEPAAGGDAHVGHLYVTKGMVQDAQRRLELLGVAPQEIEAITKSRKLQRALPLRAPAGGYVINKHVVVGMTVSPGMPMFELADLSTVWVIAEVYESDIRRVRIKQPARFEVAAYPGESFSGKVQFVYPTVDASSRTLRVRLEFRNQPGPGGLKLRPGMYGNVLLDLPATKGLMVPGEAVVDTGDVQYVFVMKEGGHFEPRRVKLGGRADDKAVVLEGLKEGETVVTTANFLIDSESRLRAAIEGQAAQPARSSSEGQGSSCDKEFDARKYPEKARACRACEVQHRGMGTMEEDCKKAISKPWR